jgi:hypothetical protein
MKKNKRNSEQDNSAFEEYSQIVISELERMDREMVRINGKLEKISLDIANLKGKSASWGMLSGGLVSIVVALIIHLLTK